MKDAEPSATPLLGERTDAWKVLIADDDDAVHQVTRMVMAGFEFDGRPVHFISAYSGGEACRIVQQEPDIALLLLDVVMEDDQAGLKAVRYIREVVANYRIRIVLRTGQPGQAPEEEVIRRYDINDYRDKTELTKPKLVTLFLSALRAYRDIQRHSQPVAASVSFLPGSGAIPSDIWVSGLAHEVGTPLGVAISSLSYLQELLETLSHSAGQGTFPAADLSRQLSSGREAVQLAMDNLQRSTELIKSYKAAAMNKFVPTSVRFDLLSLLHDLIKSLQPETQPRSVAIEVTGPKSLAVSADAGALSQILSNLIMNSLRHGFSDSDTSANNRIHIAVTPLEENGVDAGVQLLYQDTGKGIPDELRNKVFDAFFTTSVDGSGTGIGLSVARELAQKRLSGSLQLISAPFGACFRLVFPSNT